LGVDAVLGQDWLRQQHQCALIRFTGRVIIKTDRKFVLSSIATKTKQQLIMDSCSAFHSMFVLLFKMGKMMIPTNQRKSQGNAVLDCLISLEAQRYKTKTQGDKAYLPQL
jgi:hypothetical protein